MALLVAERFLSMEGHLRHRWLGPVTFRICISGRRPTDEIARGRSSVGITTGVKLRSPEGAQRPRASSASTS
jgi:hypothetical protein